MSETAVMDAKDAPLKFDEEATMSRYSPILGEVSVYAPDVEPTLWGQRPWLMKTERGWTGQDSPGLYYIILYEHLQHCYHHPALIEPMHQWPEP